MAQKVGDRARDTAAHRTPNLGLSSRILREKKVRPEPAPRRKANLPIDLAFTIRCLPQDRTDPRLLVPPLEPAPSHARSPRPRSAPVP